MPELLHAILWVLAAAPAVLLLVFATEVFLGVRKGTTLHLSGQLPVTCILIPAHNEEAMIADTLARLRPALSCDISVLVVADNCTDGTAAEVKRAGFEVLERFDAEHRGKGYALAFGRDHLQASPPACVIVFDADCLSDPQSIMDLARCSIEKGSAVQARYIFEPDCLHSPKVQISNFAFWVKNVVRQRGTRRIGGGAVLTGTGMAFPWAIFASMPLATGSIVEDLELSVGLTRTGNAPVFLEQALVTSEAANESATLEQRSRWEHGFLSIARSHGMPMLWQGLLQRNGKAVLLGLHLLVPPLALLILLSLAAAGALALAAVVTGYWFPLALLMTILAIAIGGVFLNWAIEGHVWLKPKLLLILPLYLIWKLPVYARFLIGRRATWVRTERN